MHVHRASGTHGGLLGFNVFYAECTPTPLYSDLNVFYDLVSLQQRANHSNYLAFLHFHWSTHETRNPARTHGSFRVLFFILSLCSTISRTRVVWCYTWISEGICETKCQSRALSFVQKEVLFSDKRPDTRQVLYRP